MPPQKRRRQVENKKRKKPSLKVRELKTSEGESTCGVEREEAEQRSLADLPRHVKERIFKKLPLLSISQTRLVCKEWDSILSSCSFMSSLPEHNPWLLLWAQEYCMAYCFSTKKWMKISLSFLPAPVKEENICVYKYSSAELGLILRQTSALHVCNPLTKDYTQIERDASGTVIGIVQGERVGEPYLVVNLGSCHHLKKFSIRVYHYFQDSWRIKFEFAEKNNFDIYPHVMLACNGFLFFGAKRPVVIVGFSIRGSSIKPCRVAALPCHILSKKVYQLLMVEYGLSILVIAMTKDKLNAMIILELFQDDKDEFLWKWREFATIPSMFLPDYFKKRYGHFVAVGYYLCFSRRNGKFAGVAYNLKEGSWQCLPLLPDFDFSMVSSFQPKLKVKERSQASAPFFVGSLPPSVTQSTSQMDQTALEKTVSSN